MLIDGKKIRNEKIQELKNSLKGINEKLGLAVVQVGEDAASSVYVKQKEKLALELGYKFIHEKLDEKINEDELIQIVNKLNNDDSIHGIIVQLPLPKHIDETKVINVINPLKDVDGLTFTNAGKLINGKDTLIPCTPKGIIDLLKAYKIDIEGKNVVVIGRSILVGKPIATLLTNNNATVTICHSKTKDISLYTKKADIIVVAVGKAKFLTNEMVKKNSIVIDVGINRINGKLYGDADFEDLELKCKYITPVPGGVGPMTVYELCQNVYEAYLLQNK